MAAGFCENCGAPLAQDVSFCESCGSRIAAPMVQAEAEAPKAASPTPLEAPAKSASGKRSKWMKIGGIALVAVVILTGGYIWKNQNDPTTWYYRGSDLYGQGKYDEAIKAYDKAIEIVPSYADAWTGKGNALYGLGKYDEAIKCYDEAIRLYPNYAAAWHSKGNALSALGRNTEAQTAFAKAKEVVYTG